MPYFISPKVLFGKGSLKRLGPEMEGKGGKALLITDKTMVEFAGGLVETLENAGLYGQNMGRRRNLILLSGAALAAGKALLAFEPQWVIGFGGGSAIDTAKAAWVFYERPDLAGQPIIPKIQLNLRRKARFLSVPTTSGTGADATWVAVLTDTAKQQKLILAHNDMVPDLVDFGPGVHRGNAKGIDRKHRHRYPGPCRGWIHVQTTDRLQRRTLSTGHEDGL